MRRVLFVDESFWIKRVLSGLPLRDNMTVLDIGSSTLEFRTVIQPHIDANVFAPLRQRGLRIRHLDARQAPGVDIVADVTTLDRIEGRFDLVFCTNLLEHVTDRTETIENVKRLVNPDGALVLTVPNRYPLHDDPIDTGFRPTERELGRLLGWPVIDAELVKVRDRAHYQGRRRFRRLILPWRIACVVARKPR